MALGTVCFCTNCANREALDNGFLSVHNIGISRIVSSLKFFYQKSQHCAVRPFSIQTSPRSIARFSSSSEENVITTDVLCLFFFALPFWEPAWLSRRHSASGNKAFIFCQHDPPHCCNIHHWGRNYAMKNNRKRCLVGREPCSPRAIFTHSLALYVKISLSSAFSSIDFEVSAGQEVVLSWCVWTEGFESDWSASFTLAPRILIWETA